MIASRGMGAISPSKMPKAKRKARRDSTDFTQYAVGGSVIGELSPRKSRHPYSGWAASGKMGTYKE